MVLFVTEPRPINRLGPCGTAVVPRAKSERKQKKSVFILLAIFVEALGLG